jgi:hypothetical protein
MASPPWPPPRRCLRPARQGYLDPIIGEIDIRYAQLADEDQTPFICSVESHSASERARALLDSWSATPTPSNIS